MTILLGLLGLAVGIWLLVYLARRLDLPVGPEAQGSLPRKIALVVLAMLTVGLGVCGGAGTLAGVIDFFSVKRRGEIDFGPMFLAAGVVGLICAGLGLGLLHWLSRRPRPPESKGPGPNDRP
ncbi:MAG: hypothetical protein HY902_15275 [Deltaproteobacteria bacterium]|nr:hypothetical protein [Deltaproteobacteria bacterium]